MGNLFNITLAGYFLSLILYLAHLILKRDPLEKAGRTALFLSLLGNTGVFVMRWREAGRPPLTNMYESIVFFAWSIAAIYILFSFFYNVRILGFPVSLSLLLTLGYASFLDDGIRPLVPALQSNWLTIHVVTCFLGYAGFLLAFAASIVYFVLAVRKSPGAPTVDELAYHGVAFGFIFLAIGIITGAVWANQAWGTYWSWDPKETASLITWILYAAYLHMRALGWKGTKSAWLLVLGFLAMLFTYFGVNYLLPGLHSYA